jgi:hypothetical protein
MSVGSSRAIEVVALTFVALVQVAVGQAEVCSSWTVVRPLLPAAGELKAGATPVAATPQSSNPMVEYGNGVFVAILPSSWNSGACAAALTSLDGLSWTRTATWGYPAALRYVHGRFVVLDWTGTIVSRDGVSWTRHEMGIPITSYPYPVHGGLCWSDRELLVSAWDTDDNSSRLLSSQDGETWTERPFPYDWAAGRGLTGNGSVAALFRHGTVAPSADLATWAEQATVYPPAGFNTQLAPPAWVRGRYLAFGVDRATREAVAMWSDDGASWELAPTGITSQDRILDVVDTGAALVALGTSRLLVSRDGLGWQEENPNPAGGDETLLYDLAWQGRRLVAVGLSPADGGGELTATAFVGDCPGLGSAGDPGEALVVPGLGHLDGVGGSAWRSDLDLANPGPAVARIRLELVARDQGDPPPPALDLELDPGTQRRLLDVVGDAFDTEGAGTLRVVPTAGAVNVAARTYHAGSAGSYGQAIPARAVSRAFGFGQGAHLIGLAEARADSYGVRTNLGLVSTCAVQQELVVDLYLDDGSPLGSLRRQIGPWESTQLGHILAEVSPQPVAGAFAVVHTTTEGGLFLAYASVVDNQSQDAVFVWAE